MTFGAASMFTHVTAYQLADGLTPPCVSQASTIFVTSMAAGIATRSGRPVPGQDLHLLEQRAFARHTWTTTASLPSPLARIDQLRCEWGLSVQGVDFSVLGVVLVIKAVLKVRLVQAFQFWLCYGAGEVAGSVLAFHPFTLPGWGWG